MFRTGFYPAVNAGSSQQRQRVDNPDGRNHRKCQRKLPISSHSSRGNHLRNPQVGEHVRCQKRIMARIVVVARRGRSTSRSNPAAPRG